MRCFEAMGCGALLVLHNGNYPPGMTPGVTIETYGSAEVAAATISQALMNWPRSAEIAARGRNELNRFYTKTRQWRDFVNLVERI